MKKILLIVVFVILISAAVWGGIFAWNNLRGIGPVIKPPSKDISQLIPKPIQNNPAENKTSLPLNIPDKFSFSIFADSLVDPRVLAMDPRGNLIVSITKYGKIVLLPDLNNDGVADEPLTLISNLNQPHGLAFRCIGGVCQLYIAETNQVDVFDYDIKNFQASNKRKIIDLPGGGEHFTRTLLYDQKNDKLFISLGSDCNVCKETNQLRTKILISNPDGTDLHVYASGLRNSVFMTFRLITHELWATEMGRDYLGDDLPPDEIDIIKEGKDYGWPYCYGKSILDVTFDPNHDCSQTEPSFIDIPAHSAPLGLAFFPTVGWPVDFQNNLLVSYHGSWNRSVPTGYKVIRYKLDSLGNVLSVEDFISGWLQNDGTALGRPVDILITEKGIIYISDDKAGVIYRMVYIK